jgi:hypothetical protein
MTINDFELGMIVSHNKYGFGEILKIVTKDNCSFLFIDFNELGGSWFYSVFDKNDKGSPGFDVNECILDKLTIIKKLKDKKLFQLKTNILIKINNLKIDNPWHGCNYDEVDSVLHDFKELLFSIEYTPYRKEDYK